MREIRNSSLDDLGVILEIYAAARAFMVKNGNPTQWSNNRPAKETIIADIEAKHHYVIVDDGEIVGCFTAFIGPDVTYGIIEDGEWLNDDEYVVIHKVAGAAGGILKSAVDFVCGMAPSIRIDTHKDNTVMQHVILKNGFKYCGIIYTDDGTKRLAYQR